ncbi:MAG: ATP-dependent metallopeptidase FtsH/Yme1/Tma family protein, partial [Candidatus Paceibacteria bacterium]
MSPAKKAERVSFSELVAKINTGEISKIEVDGNNITATLKDGTQLRTQKEEGSSLVELLRSYGVSQEKIAGIELEVSNGGAISGFWISLLLQVLLPFVLILLLFLYISRQAQKGAVQAFTFGKANIRIFANPKERTTFKDIAGLKEAKEELKEVVDFLRSPQKFLDIGARIPRGVLLMGAPGTGKTMLARAVAGEANVPFFHISGSEFVEMFVGVGAARVRDLFATAKKAAPSIVFIDEIDAVVRQRGAGLGGGHDE